MVLRRSGLHCPQQQQQQQQQQPRCPTGTPAVDPADPEPPPDEGEQAPEVTTTSDAGRENLALSQTDASPDASTDGRATTTVSVNACDIRQQKDIS
jgi:hypothetical protein